MAVKADAVAVPKRARLSLKEFLDFVPAFFRLVLAALHAALTGFSRGPGQAKSLFLHVGYAFLRKSTQRLSTAQLQAFSPPSNKTYARFARGVRQTPETVQLGHGALGHWIGDKNAKNVLIWYHGGGFALPANIGYFRFYHNVVKQATKAGKSLAVFSLTYTLAPQASYPTQLRQAVECLRYILNASPHRSPSDICLAGDSAGGNLLFGVLSHISHPHPEIEPLELQSVKLAGAIALSPWVYLETDFNSQQIDATGDLITDSVAKVWAPAYLGGRQRDNYTDLMLAPEDWCKDFQVEKILVLAGGNEILMPVIEELMAKLTKTFPNAELFVGERECHVAPVYNLYLGDKTETTQGLKLYSWLIDLL